MTPLADPVPVPRHLSEEERALWENASGPLADVAGFKSSVLRSLLTALSSEREAGEALRGLIHRGAVRDEAGEPLRYGSLLPECAGGLAYFPVDLGLKPARTLDEAIDAALADARS